MITKTSLRDQIRDYLILEITQGNLASGQKLSLAELARKLDVSVTPVREALTQLEQTGIIEAKQNLGFFIRKLELNEASDIYRTIGFIEKLAIGNLNFRKAEIQELKSIHNKMIEAKTPLDRLRTDHLFHHLLIKRYSNTTLKNIVENLKVSVYINELEYMGSDFTVESHLSHLKIIGHLEKNDLKLAGDEIKDHWNLSYEFLKKATNDKK